MIKIPMYEEFTAGITTSTSTGINASALGIIQSGKDLTFGTGLFNKSFSLTIKDMTPNCLNPLTASMLADSYKLNTTLVAYANKGTTSMPFYTSGSSYAPANKPTYKKASILGAAALTFALSVGRGPNGYVISGYLSSVGTAAAGQNQSLTFADKVLGKTEADIIALSKQLGYGL